MYLGANRDGRLMGVRSLGWYLCPKRLTPKSEAAGSGLQVLLLFSEVSLGMPVLRPQPLNFLLAGLVDS